MSAAVICQVCVLNTKHDAFDYLSGPCLPAIGSRVWVPFRQHMRLGIILSHHGSNIASRALKTIHAIIDSEPLIDTELLSFCHWVSHYYHAPMADVLKLALPKQHRLGKVVTKTNPTSPDILDPLALLKSAPLQLNAEQQHAVYCVEQNLERYQCYLLHGVTGSGKTEVYLQLVHQVLMHSRQVLILVPEIGLTPQLLERFQARFHCPIAVVHSHLTDNERACVFLQAQANQVALVIGTRTALFTPMPHLGLIIIDEEHDSSLKQMHGVFYCARDAALVRASRRNIPIILGSATPSLESINNCRQHKYQLLRLTHKALNRTPLHFQLIDIRNQALTHGLADVTRDAIAQQIRLQRQVLIFINRRGFAPVLLCHQCGWMADCSACDSHLTLHKRHKKMLCHHCDASHAIPTQCQRCQSTDLVPVGAGTQRIQQGLSQQFPTTPILRIDRDAIKKNATSQQAHFNQLTTAPIMIGTQMLAKGHHFQNLALVVVLDTDAGFYNQDFRALERLGQLITQVAGRAGRAQVPGQVLIQTHLPQHPLLLQLIQDGYERFADTLLTLRQEGHWPPYSYLALIRAEGKIATVLTEFLTQLKAQLDHLSDHSLQVMGPAEAPMARKAHQHHMQLLIKSSSRQQLNQVLVQLRQSMKTHASRGIRWRIDVDPVTLG